MVMEMIKNRLKLKTLIIIFFSCVAMLIAVGCKNGKTSEENSADDFTLTLESSVSFMEFETYRLTVGGVSETEEIVWTSTDQTVVTVSDDGVLNGIRSGTTAVKAEVKGHEAICNVTVTPTIYAHSIVLSENEVSMIEGGAYTVEADILFKGEKLGAPVTYEWKPLDGAAEIVTVKTSENGRIAEITGKHTGSAVYEASATVRGYYVSARLTVTVNATVVVFDFENDKLIKGEGYSSINLTLGNSDNAAEIGEIRILANGIDKGEAVAEWRSLSPEIADVENGKITAFSAGSATVTGTVNYNGKEYEIVLKALVSKQRKQIDNFCITLETGVQEFMVLPSVIDGSKVVNVLISDKTIFDKSYAVTDGKVKLLKDNLPCLPENMGENKIISVETDDTVYSVKANIYTMIINSKVELDGWQKIACSEAVKAKQNTDSEYGRYMTGYFVLGEDIEYNGSYKPFKNFFDYWKLDNSADWSDGGKFGFNGIFDGMGHSIVGMEISTSEGTDLYNAFIVTLSGGIVRNVAFLNSAVSGSASLVVRAGYGTCENIFVQYDRIGEGTDNAGTFFGSGEMSRVLNACIICIENCNFSSLKKMQLVASVKCVLNGVYVVGAFEENDTATLFDSPFDDDDKAGAYVTWADLFSDSSAAAIIDGWNESFWHKGEKIAVPQNIFDKYSEEHSILNSETTVEKDSSLVLKSDGLYVDYSLENSIEGVNIEGGTLKVDSSVEIGSVISVVAKSLINGYEVKKQFTVTAKSVVTYLSGVRNVNLNLSMVSGTLKSENVIFDISDAVDLKGKDITAKYNGFELYKGKYADRIELDFTEAIKAETVGGQSIITLEYSDESVDYKVIATVLIVGRTFNAGEAADFSEVIKSLPNGYFMLGGNLDFGGAVMKYIGDFGGTLDGCGFGLCNFKISYMGDENGYTKNVIKNNYGVIKNLYLGVIGYDYDAGNGNVGFIYDNYGTLSNIYMAINLTKSYSGVGNNAAGLLLWRNAGPTGIVKNCVVNVKAEPGVTVGAGSMGAIQCVQWIGGDWPKDLSECYVITNGVNNIKGLNNKNNGEQFNVTEAENVTKFAEAIGAFTAEKGWSNYWSYENGTLKFGDTLIM